MNPLPLSSVVRLLLSLAKDSAQVADKSNRFSSCVEPIGVPIRLISSRLRSMGAIGQQFGEVIQEVEQSPKEISAERLPDIPRVTATIKQCQEILKTIESSIAEATKRIATDPDFPDKVVHLRKRELEQYGLTHKGLRILSLKIQQLSGDLELQKESLVLANLRHEEQSNSPHQSPAREELKLYEREIAELSRRLEKVGKVIQKLETTEPRSRSSSYERIRRRGTNDTDRNLAWDSNEVLTTRIRPIRPDGRTRVEDRRYGEDRRDGDRLRIERRSFEGAERAKAMKEAEERIRKEERMRKHTEERIRKEAEAKYGIVALRESSKADRNQSEKFKESTIKSSPNILDLVAYQATGLLTTSSTKNLLGGNTEAQAHRMPIFYDELLNTLDRQRRNKRHSVQKQYGKLSRSFHEQIATWIAQCEKDTGLEWTIASIDIQKSRSLFRVQAERVQVILQGQSKRSDTKPPSNYSATRTPAAFPPIYAIGRERRLEQSSGGDLLNNKTVLDSITHRDLDDDEMSDLDDGWVWSKAYKVMDEAAKSDEARFTQDYIIMEDDVYCFNDRTLDFADSIRIKRLENGTFGERWWNTYEEESDYVDEVENEQEEEWTEEEEEEEVWVVDEEDEEVVVVDEEGEVVEVVEVD